MRLNFESNPHMAHIKNDMEGGDHHRPVLDHTVILAVQEFEAYRAVLRGDIIAEHLHVFPDGDPHPVLGFTVPPDLD
jgi:hypothetical protein